MTAATERRRPAVPAHPLAAVPAATVARVLPWLDLAVGVDVVHALAEDKLRWPRCGTRVRALTNWGGEPMRMCSLCAAALGFPSLVPGWKPTRAELAEVHLAAATAITARAAEALADVRSAAISDGSALMRIDEVPSWRLEHRITEDTPLLPLRSTQIVGELLTLPTSAAGSSSTARSTERLVDSNTRRREDRADIRAARHSTHGSSPRCPYCAIPVLVARDHATEETVLINLKRVHGGRVAINRPPGSPELAVAVDHITSPAPSQPAWELHSRTCPAWPAEPATDLADETAEKSGGWRR